MTNRFRSEIEEELEPEIQPGAEKAELPKNFVTTFFTEGVMSKESATEVLPFIIFIVFLGMIYIGNRHFAENNIRDIDRVGKEVKELSWEYKTLKSDLMLKSTQTEVAKQVDTLGLQQLTEPPKRIVIESEK